MAGRVVKAGSPLAKQFEAKAQEESLKLKSGVAPETDKGIRGTPEVTTNEGSLSRDLGFHRELRRHIDDLEMAISEHAPTKEATGEVTKPYAQSVAPVLSMLTAARNELNNSQTAHIHGGSIDSPETLTRTAHTAVSSYHTAVTHLRDAVTYLHSGAGLGARLRLDPTTGQAITKETPEGLAPDFERARPHPALAKIRASVRPIAGDPSHSTLQKLTDDYATHVRSSLKTRPEPFDLDVRAPEGVARSGKLTEKRTISTYDEKDNPVEKEITVTPGISASTRNLVGAQEGVYKIGAKSRDELAGMLRQVKGGEGFPLTLKEQVAYKHAKENAWKLDAAKIHFEGTNPGKSFRGTQAETDPIGYVDSNGITKAMHKTMLNNVKKHGVAFPVLNPGSELTEDSGAAPDLESQIASGVHGALLKHVYNHWMSKNPIPTPPSISSPRIVPLSHWKARRSEAWFNSDAFKDPETYARNNDVQLPSSSSPTTKSSGMLFVSSPEVEERRENRAAAEPTSGSASPSVAKPSRSSKLLGEFGTGGNK